MELLLSLLPSLLALIGTLAGTYFSNRRSAALIAYRLEQLEKRVQAHNGLVERTYRLEGEMAEAQHDIQDLKGAHYE